MQELQAIFFAFEAEGLTSDLACLKVSLDAEFESCAEAYEHFLSMAFHTSCCTLATPTPPQA